MASQKAAQPARKRWWLALVLAAVVVLVGGAVVYKFMPSADRQLALGRTAMAQGEYRAALLHFRNAVSISPERADARLALAEINLKLGDAPSAVKEAQQALALGPRSDRTVDILAHSLVLSNQVDELEKLLGSVSEPVQKAIVEAWRGFGFQVRRDPAQASAAFQRALALDPKQNRAKLGIVAIALQGGDKAAADALLSNILSGDPKNAEALVLRAQLKLSNQDVEGAKADYTAAIAADRTQVGALIGRGLLLFEQNELEAAGSDAAEALKLAPRQVIANFIMAAIAFKKNEFQQVVERLQVFGNALQEYPPSLYVMSLAQIKLGQLAQAENNLDRYVKLVPNNLAAHMMLAELFGRRNNFQRAVDELRPLAETQTATPEVMLALAAAYMNLGNGYLAAQWYDKVAAKSEGDAQSMLKVGLGRARLGQGEQAIKDIQAAIAIDPSSVPARTALTLALLRQGKQSEALGTAEKLLADKPDNSGIRQLVATVHTITGDWEKARAALQEAIRLQPTLTSAKMSLAQLDVRDGFVERAIETYKSILSSPTGSGQAALALSELELARDNSAAGLDYLEKARQESETAAAASNRAVRLLVKMGRSDRALEIARDLQTKDTANALGYEALAAAQDAAGEKAAAIGTLRQLVALNPRAPQPYMVLASTLARRGDRAQAFMTYKQLLGLLPGYQPALFAAMAIEINEGRLQEAEKMASDWAQRQKYGLPAKVLVGQALIVAQRSKEAVAAFQEALNSAPNSQEIANRLYSAHLSAGDYRELEQLLAPRVADAQVEPSIRLLLADAYLQLKDYDKSAKQYEAILAAQPKSAIALNNLAWIYGQRGDQRAVAMAETANRMAAGTAAIQDTLGQLLVKAGDIERGAWLLRFARTNGLNDADSSLVLAQALISMKRTDEARSVLKSVMDSGSDDAKAKAAELTRQLP